MPRNLCIKCKEELPLGAPICPFCQTPQAIAEADVEIKKKQSKRAREVDLNLEEMEYIPVRKEVEAVVEKEEKATEEIAEEVVKEVTEEIQEESQKEVSKIPTEVVFNEDIYAEAESDAKNEEIPTASDEELSVRKTKKETADFEYMAFHDSLTDLKNRASFEEAQIKIKTTEATIISIDANGLKRLNDTVGHEAGDKMIKAIAKSLKAAFGDNAYRVGGDEFIVLLCGIDKKTVKEHLAYFEKMLEKYSKEDQVEYRVAIGTAYGGDSVQKMLEEADKKMYECKNKMKNTYNPNFDGYYNDTIVAEYEEMHVDLSSDVLKKIIAIVVVAIVLILIVYVVIFNILL